MVILKRVNDYICDIMLTRGDSLLLTVEMFTVNREPYIPEEGDTVRFAMKRYYSDSECLVEKNIPTDTLLLELLPTDTKSLPMGAEYVYDIQLTTAAGKVDTFLKGKIKIDSEVK